MFQSHLEGKTGILKQVLVPVSAAGEAKVKKQTSTTSTIGLVENSVFQALHSYNRSHRALISKGRPFHQVEPGAKKALTLVECLELRLVLILIVLLCIIALYLLYGAPLVGPGKLEYKITQVNKDG